MPMTSPLVPVAALDRLQTVFSEMVAAAVPLFVIPYNFWAPEVAELVWILFAVEVPPTVLPLTVTVPVVA